MSGMYVVLAYEKTYAYVVYKWMLFKNVPTVFSVLDHQLKNICGTLTMKGFWQIIDYIEPDLHKAVRSTG